MIYTLLRSLLFLLPPETAHKLTLKSLTFLYKIPFFHKKTPDSTSGKTVMGLQFKNPIGLGAGLDKNGQYIDPLATLGFGFIEIGTITPKPQSGNPKPRLFRVSKAEALINRMGFNNQGVDALIENIKKSKYRGILGINIGKNASTPIENAADDYVFCLEKVYPYASYITVNISSPNTPGLRQLQNRNDLNNLLDILKKAQKNCTNIYKKYVPLVIKISPDLNTQELKNIAENLLAHNIDGVIATNTTLSREAIIDFPFAHETGGLSGKPLFNHSLEIVQQLHQYLGDKIPIIACGGISSKEDVKKMQDAGASLIQIYTGLIYKGPALIKKLVN